MIGLLVLGGFTLAILVAFLTLPSTPASTGTGGGGQVVPREVAE